MLGLTAAEVAVFKELPGAVLRRVAREPLRALMVLLVVSGGIYWLAVNHVPGSAEISHEDTGAAEAKVVCQQVWDTRFGNPLVESQTYAEFMFNCQASAKFSRDGDPNDLNGTTR